MILFSKNIGNVHFFRLLFEMLCYTFLESQWVILMTKNEKDLMSGLLKSGSYGASTKIRMLRNLFNEGPTGFSSEKVFKVAEKLMSSEQYALFRKEYTKLLKEKIRN